MGEPFKTEIRKWDVTVWMIAYGVWCYYVSRGDTLYKGTVEAYDRVTASEEAMRAEGL